MLEEVLAVWGTLCVVALPTLTTCQYTPPPPPAQLRQLQVSLDFAEGPNIIPP